MKKIFRSVHLYLALAAGLFIFMSCLTGTILVFQHEIENSVYHERYFVEPKEARLPLQTLLENVNQSMPESMINGVRIYLDRERTLEISLIGSKKNKKTAYLNPFTGKVIDVVDETESFFYSVEMLHRRLLSSKKGFGNAVIGITTLIFFFILITGIILWWPETKRILQLRLKINWKTGWKRTNNDWHVAMGFYTAVFLLIIVVTGLVMKYDWMNKGIFVLTGSKMERTNPPKSTYLTHAKRLTLDEVNQSVSTKLSHIEFYSINLPNDSSSAYAVNLYSSEALQATYFFDQYSGTAIGTQRSSDRNAGQRIRSFIKPIHMGTLWGLPTKILGFVVCLVGLTFPITGVIKWINRTKNRGVTI